MTTRDTQGANAQHLEKYNNDPEYARLADAKTLADVHERHPEGSYYRELIDGLAPMLERRTNWRLRQDLGTWGEKIAADAECVANFEGHCGAFNAESTIDLAIKCKAYLEAFMAMTGMQLGDIEEY